VRAPRRAGVTLVELMVAIALATMLIGTASFIFIESRKLYDHSLVEINTANELRAAFEGVARDLRDVQPTWGANWELRIDNQNPAEGPTDTLTFVTLERRTGVPTPVQVRVQLGPRDAEGLASLTRQVLRRFNAAAGTLDAVTEPERVLLRNVRLFVVEYAWVPELVDGPLGHGFVRGAGAAPLDGPATTAGARFFFGGSASITGRTVTVSTTPWSGAKRIPRRLAKTFTITSPATAAGTYPILDVVSATELSVLGAPEGTVQFLVPLLPPALQLTVRHEGQNGPRSHTQVMIVNP
jgi:hypothetical protein